jgi:hypothetical protein
LIRREKEVKRRPQSKIELGEIHVVGDANMRGQDEEFLKDKVNLAGESKSKCKSKK